MLLNFTEKVGIMFPIFLFASVYLFWKQTAFI
jgi:hypothetical protein